MVRRRVGRVLLAVSVSMCMFATSVVGVSAASKKAIVPSKPGIAVSSKLSGMMTVRWRQVNYATGYQVVIGHTAKFTTGKKVFKLSKYNNTKDIRRLKEGKRYYAKVRAYRKTSKYTTYGKWSNIKSIRIKETPAKQLGKTLPDHLHYYKKVGELLAVEQRVVIPGSSHVETMPNNPIEKQDYKSVHCGICGWEKVVYGKDIEDSELKKIITDHAIDKHYDIIDTTQGITEGMKSFPWTVGVFINDPNNYSSHIVVDNYEMECGMIVKERTIQKACVCGKKGLSEVSYLAQDGSHVHEYVALDKNDYYDNWMKDNKGCKSQCFKCGVYSKSNPTD